MKKTSLLFLLMFMLSSINTNSIYAAVLEKGNPVGVYHQDFIELPGNKRVELSEDYTALFVNGTLVTDYNIMIRNDRALVPIRFISQQLGAYVDWNGKEGKVTIEKSQDKIVLYINKNKAVVNHQEVTLDHVIVLHNDLTYIPLRFISENLGATVTYAPRLGTEYDYYYDTKMPISPSNTIIRDFPNIIIDESYDFDDVLTKDEAMERVKRTCKEGLENFIKNTKESLIASGEDPERFDPEFKSIEKEINRMLYIGQVSRYYKFTIGPYDILYDRYNHNIFFQKYSSATIIEKVNVNDSDLYMLIFIIG